MSSKCRILVIGATGYIGKFIVEASVKAGNPTFALVRESTLADPVKGKFLHGLRDRGVTLLFGDLYNHESLVKALKQVDVVISTVGNNQMADQVKIVAAIKEAGTIKRFLPSDFGTDVDRTHAVEPAKTMFETKARVRRAVEAAGIPHTFVCANSFAGYFLPTLGQFTAVNGPPRDKVIIFGDGNAKASFNSEEDIGAFTIKAVDDPRTLDKILYVKPPNNTYSFNEIVALWEFKIGKKLEKVYVSEEKLLKDITETPKSEGGDFPMDLLLALSHSVFVKGDQTNFEIEASFGVEASELYPDFKYTTVEEYLQPFI